MLEINNLFVSYGYVMALKGVNIKVEKGSIVSIIGSNGAGKTSLLRAISGLVKAKGEVVFENKNILGFLPEDIVSIGIIHCPEGRRIFQNFTIEENLKMGAYLKYKDIKNINNDFERVYNLFPKLKERRKQLAGTLSGGEQQMLAIARSLMSKPKILMMDEPSLGLAPVLVTEIFKIIEDIKKEGVTILLVEQNANRALSISDYTYVLETGKIVLEGRPMEILKDEAVKKAYLGA